ncbi:hypothetical protein M422DRAFT_57670 [Sphaerobolus stellatus SS14]|nr:hypothetical protein M422DRAFT_57670 [Sphaerobolus stellatus SS14]
MLSAKDIRLLCRSNSFCQPTAGLCPTESQANLLILPEIYADNFRKLCARNPVSCPLLGESPAPGDPSIPPSLGRDGDVRTDAPKYHVYINGKLEKVVEDITEEWEEDSVAFFIGCSFSFERALTKAGLAPRHVTTGSNVSMYRSKMPLNPAGILKGNVIVSMRPYHPSVLPDIQRITRMYPTSHGEPIAWVSLEAVDDLGIPALNRPCFGDPVEIKSSAGEIPVFWGCGVTAQVAVMESLAHLGVKVMGHAPGHMVCCDLPSDIVPDNSSMQG